MEAKVDQTPAMNSNPVLSIDKNGCIVYSNETGNLLLNEWDVKIGDKLPSSIANTVQKVITQNNPEKMEVKVGIRIYLIVFHPLPEQECVNISGFDISDQKKVEEETKESEERLNALMDHNPSLLFMKDECGRYVYLNNAYEKQFVHSKDWYGKTDFDFWPKESAESFQKNDSLVLKSGQTYQFMEDSTGFSGARYCWLNYKFPFTDSKNKKYVGGIGIDATDRVRAEEALRENSRKFAEAIEAERKRFFDMLETLPVMICLMTPDYHVAFASRAFRDKFGESHGRHCYEYCCGYKEPCGFCQSFKPLETGQPHHWEFTSPDGSIIIDAYDFPFTDVDGSPMILEMDIDITERRRAEEALKEAHDTLEEKVKERTSELEKAYKFLQEIDIVRKQEIHHRIKNNLQVISSLLDLQAEKFRGEKNIEDSQVLEAFKESQDRVISMALIHEELHKGGEIDTLNFSTYIQKLADKLFFSYRLGNEGTSLNIDVEEDIFFGMDTSVPLGIIINELVSNSLQHAFSGRDNGEIRIRLHREENKKCEIDGDKSTTFILSVSDNGIGIPEDIDIEDIGSLGLQLVTTLIEQLDGELELKRNNGTEFIIKFKVTEKK